MSILKRHAGRFRPPGPPVRAAIMLCLAGATLVLAQDKPHGGDAVLARAAIDAHNKVRSEAKLPPVESDPVLEAAALAQAKDMAARGVMTHEGGDGSKPSERLDRLNYDYQTMAENVARGQPTVESVMNGWMNSPPHRKNILGPFERVGIAVARDADGTPFWCADFATPWPSLEPAKAAAEVAERINTERKRAGKHTLHVEKRLTAVAASESRAMADASTLDEKPSRGDEFGRSLKESGYRFTKVVELAAAGPPLPADVVASWVKGAPDNQNLLGEFTDVGVGYTRGKKGVPYWCLILARPSRLNPAR